MLVFHIDLVGKSIMQFAAIEYRKLIIFVCDDFYKIQRQDYALKLKVEIKIILVLC